MSHIEELKDVIQKLHGAEATHGLRQVQKVL